MKKSFPSILILCAFALVLFGFVHPPEFHIETWTSKTQSIRSLHIKQTRFLTLAGRSDQVSFEEEVWILRPGFYRRTSRGLAREVHWIVDAQRAGKVENGQFSVEKLASVVEPHETTFFSGSSERLVALLRQSGIDSETSHWVLEGDIEALAVGKFQENRFAFDKETSFPLSAHLGSYFYLFPVDRPQKFRTPYPSKVEVYHDGVLKETILIHDVEINSPVSKSIFDVSTLREPSKRTDTKSKPQ